MRKPSICLFVVILFCMAAICQAESFTQSDLDGPWAFDRDNTEDIVMPEQAVKRMREMPGKYVFKFDTANNKVEMFYDGELVQPGTMNFISSDGNKFSYQFDGTPVELELKDKNTLLFKSEGTVQPFKRDK